MNLMQALFARNETMALEARQKKQALLDEFAKGAMQGLLAGISGDQFNLISGPQVAVTAYDIAACMMDERARAAKTL